MSEISFKSGIYKITNVINHKCYYGSSADLKKRKKDHFLTLKNNKHSNTYLQNEVNKYGIKNFCFEILEYCDKEFLLSTEQTYLDKFWDKKKMCYNIRKKAQISSDEINKILSNKLTGKKNPFFGKHGKENPNSKRIYQFNKAGESINVFYGSVEAEQKTGINKCSINQCCNNKLKTAGGFLWSYTNKSPTIVFANPPQRKKKITLIGPDKQKYIIGNLKDFCRKHNLNYASIWSVVAKYRTSCFGWRKG